MCGRYSYTGNPNHVTTRLGIRAVPSAPRYNIAPSQFAPVIRSVEGHRPAMDQLMWGLVPFWAKDRSIGQKTINARSEKLDETGSFKTPFRYRRCLVLSDGFFEWKRFGREKQAYRILMKDESTFAFAGLWDHWNRPDGAVLETFTIVTTQANSLIRDIHHRMPVILPPSKWEMWLSQEERSPKRLQPILESFPAEAMQVYAVSDWVNRVEHDSPRCWQAVEAPPEQTELF